LGKSLEEQSGMPGYTHYTADVPKLPDAWNVCRAPKPCCTIM